MPLYNRSELIPDFPLTYEASRKRAWSPDGCWNFYTTGTAGDTTVGTMPLYPFYIRYDVPSGQLVMNAAYYANGYGVSGRSNTAVWGMYKVGTGLLDSTLYEATGTISDNSSYFSPAKSQTMTLAYPKGWYIATILTLSGNLASTTSFPKNSKIFGGNPSLTGTAVDGGGGDWGFSGRTSLPSSFAGLTLVLSPSVYQPPINLKY